MTAKRQFGINGFGRIGRTSFRVWWLYHRDTLDLKVINTSGSMEIADWAHLLKYDTNYGPFAEPITVNRSQSKRDVSDENSVLGTLTIGDRSITVTAQRDPAKIPWGAHGVAVVIESTGIFVSKEKAALHFQGGAKEVLISAPGKGDGVDTSVIGVNTYDPAATVESNASCTTNCVAPVAQIITSALGVEKASLTTIHAYTDDQNLQDNSHSDLRRARSAAENIVPTSTGAAIATTEVIPELKGLFDGIAIRVPVVAGSIVDVTFVPKRPTTVEEVNDALKKAAASERWKRVFAVSEEPLVSSDILGLPYGAIADLLMTRVVDGTLVKVLAWYDNEMGYAYTLVEHVREVAKRI